MPITSVIGYQDAGGRLVLAINTGVAFQYAHITIPYAMVSSFYSDAEMPGWTAAFSTDLTGLTLATTFTRVSHNHTSADMPTTGGFVALPAPTAVNTATTQTITLPAGMFSAAPNIVTGINGGSPWVFAPACVASVTASSFVLYGARLSGGMAVINTYWMAF
jgi:hypothetical protein